MCHAARLTDAPPTIESPTGPAGSGRSSTRCSDFTRTRGGVREHRPRRSGGVREGLRLQDETVTLTATPGPAISLRRGTLAVADPWWPETLPEQKVIPIAKGEQPTLLSTVDMPRDGTAQRIPLACAAAIGPVEEVATWQPLVTDEAHFHLDSDSALGAFYDITDASALRPLVEDARHMQQVYTALSRSGSCRWRSEASSPPWCSCAPTGRASTRPGWASTRKWCRLRARGPRSARRRRVIGRRRNSSAGSRNGNGSPSQRRKLGSSASPGED